MQSCNILEITAAIQTIRRNCPEARSNYYYQLSGQKELRFDTLRAARTIAFGYQDDLVYRVFFCTADAGELERLLCCFPDGAVMDVVTKEEKEQEWQPFFAQLPAAGFFRHALFYRYHIRDLKQRIYTGIPEDLRDVDSARYGRFAEEGQAEEIVTLLRETFDARESHLKDLRQISGMIEKGWIRVVSEEGRIVALLSAIPQGRRLYIEQVLNRGKREYIHCLYLYALEEAVRSGISYAYTWVKDGNEKGEGIAVRYGHEKDGTADSIFVKGKRT